MKTVLSAVGVLIVIAGLIWAAQGAGWFPYPKSSFMVDNSRWITIGLVTAAVGAVMVVLAQRL